jgi:hypothetical protein
MGATPVIDINLHDKGCASRTLKGIGLTIGSLSYFPSRLIRLSLMEANNDILFWLLRSSFRPRPLITYHALVYDCYSVAILDKPPVEADIFLRLSVIPHYTLRFTGAPHIFGYTAPKSF